MITIWHNPGCSTSKHALARAEALGVEVEVRAYLRRPPSRAELVEVLGKLDGDPGDLVRRDARFDELGLGDADVATPDQVADLLRATPALIQRPVLIAGDAAIIGRPKDRVDDFLRSA